jgi:hypothetical protein
MAQAKRSLSPKRALERLREHRRAVIALAHQRAKRLVQAGIRAKGQRLSDFSAREITLLAEDYLAQHRAELIAEAENAIATWPGFARWRLPPEVFEKITETEHSPNANSAIMRHSAND